jgi:hypothetical protein
VGHGKNESNSLEVNLVQFLKFLTVFTHGVWRELYVLKIFVLFRVVEKTLPSFGMWVYFAASFL